MPPLFSKQLSEYDISRNDTHMCRQSTLVASLVYGLMQTLFINTYLIGLLCLFGNNYLLPSSSPSWAHKVSNQIDWWCCVAYTTLVFFFIINAIAHIRIYRPTLCHCWQIIITNFIEKRQKIKYVCLQVRVGTYTHTPTDIRGCWSY